MEKMSYLWFLLGFFFFFNSILPCFSYAIYLSEGVQVVINFKLENEILCNMLYHPDWGKNCLYCSVSPNIIMGCATYLLSS